MPEAAHPAATPAPDRLLALTDQCVQCGLCLPACPTYRFDPLETESPRGRIALARAWELGTIPATSIGETHLDHCLGCRRCEVVCPAGVQYGPLLVAARNRQRERRSPGWKQRGAEWLSARPRLLSRLLGVYRWLFPLLPTALRPLPEPLASSPFSRLRGKVGMGARPSIETSEANAKSDALTPATPRPKRVAFGRSSEREPVARKRSLSPRKRERELRSAVALFIGCVARPYEAALRAAAQKLCASIGVDIAVPADQTCCGSLHAHAGNTATAATLANTNRVAFADTTTVLTLASGCHESVAQALPTATTLDALDFIAQRSDALHFRATRERIALHLPCTQRNVVKSDAATRALLARVPGLEIVELNAGFGCCGAAGTQMLTDPTRAAAYRQPLLDQLVATGATRLLSANIGCRLHFANSTRVPVQHPLEFLAECLEP